MCIQIVLYYSAISAGKLRAPGMATWRGADHSTDLVAGEFGVGVDLDVEVAALRANGRLDDHRAVGALEGLVQVVRLVGDCRFFLATVGDRVDARGVRGNALALGCRAAAVCSRSMNSP